MSDSDSEFSAGEIYSAEDVCDPEAFPSLCEPVPIRRFPPRQRSLTCLGVNVLRLLLTYLDARDFLRATGACKVLLKLGSETMRRPDDPQHADPHGIRTRFLESKRDLQLALHKTKGIACNMVTDPVVASLFHAEADGTRLFFFSMDDSRLVIWEYIKSAIVIKLRCEGVHSLCDSSVRSESVTLLGPTQLVKVECKWKQPRWEDIGFCAVDFPVPAPGLVRTSSNQVVVTRLSLVTVFDENLVTLRTVALGADFGAVFSILQFAHRPSLFAFVSVSNLSTYDLSSFSPALAKRLHFSSLLQSASYSSADHCYVILCGEHNESRKLFVNGKAAFTEAICFSLCKDTLLVLANQVEVFSCRFIQGKVEKELILAIGQLGNCSAIFPLSNKALTVSYYRKDSYLSETHEHLIVTVPRLTYWIKMHYSYTENLDPMQILSIFQVSSLIVIAGARCPYLEKCVTIVDYYKDDSGEEKESFEHYVLRQRQEIAAKAALAETQRLKGCALRRYLETIENKRTARFVDRRNELREHRRKLEEQRLQRERRDWKGERIRDKRSQIVETIRKIGD